MVARNLPASCAVEICMCGDLAQVIREAGLTQADVDFVLPHQANLRIIEAAKSKLSIAPEKYRHNIERFGNTSSASIPILLDELNRAGELHAGNILALTAFGGGMALINACRGRLENGFAFIGANGYKVKEIVSVKKLFETLSEEYRQSEDGADAAVREELI